MIDSPTRCSIVIPTYNRAASVRRAAQAALDQYLPCSVVVVDDGSTDRTDDALHVLFDHPRFCYVRLSRNVGTAHAKNIGLLLCGGDAISFHDSDDVPHATKLLVQARALYGNEAHRSEMFDWSHAPETSCTGYDVALSGHRLIKADGSCHDITSPLSLFDDFFPHVQALRPVEGDWVLINCGLFRREVFRRIGGFVDTVEEDRELRNRLLAGGFRIAYLPDPVLDKIETMDSLTLDPSSGYASERRAAARDEVKRQVRRYRQGRWGEDAVVDSMAPIDLPEVAIEMVSRPELLCIDGDIPMTEESRRVTAGLRNQLEVCRRDERNGARTRAER